MDRSGSLPKMPKDPSLELGPSPNPSTPTARSTASVIATPAAQAAASIEKTKPIFYAAVTDPKKAGLIRPNLCGTSDMIDVRKEIDLLLTLIPKAKKVAILFNPSEINSVILKDNMKADLELRGLQVFPIGISQGSEMAMAAISAAQKGDVILTPTDNTVAMAMPILAKVAREHKKPLIVSDNLLVEKGALAARGIDYFQSGQKAARFAFEVLVNEKKPQHIVSGGHENSVCVVNRKVLKELNLSVPDSFAGQMVFVEGDFP